MKNLTFEQYRGIIKAIDSVEPDLECEESAGYNQCRRLVYRILRSVTEFPQQKQMEAYIRYEAAEPPYYINSSVSKYESKIWKAEDKWVRVSFECIDDATEVENKVVHIAHMLLRRIDIGTKELYHWEDIYVKVGDNDQKYSFNNPWGSSDKIDVKYYTDQDIQYWMDEILGKRDYMNWEETLEDIRNNERMRLLEKLSELRINRRK